MVFIFFVFEDVGNFIDNLNVDFYLFFSDYLYVEGGKDLIG